MLDAQLAWLPNRMKRVAETNQAFDLCPVSHHVRDPAAHRLAGDHEAISPKLVNDLLPRFNEHRQLIRWPLLARSPSLSHVGKLEAGHSQTAVAKRLGKPVHK